MQDSYYVGRKRLRSYSQPTYYASRLIFRYRRRTFVAVVFAIVVGLLFVLNPGLARRSAQSDVGPHVLAIPYYSIKGDWNSTLTLNNATHQSLPVSIMLYSLDGVARPLSQVTLPPNLSRTLRLDDLLERSEAMGRFQEGSIELRFNGTGMDLGPQLTVSDTKHGLSFDIEPPMGLKSSTLEGLWWSVDDKTDALVMLSNTTDQYLAVQMNVDWHGRVIPARSFSLSSHQTMLLGITSLLKQLGIKASGIENGGLSISHNGLPGAVIAHGVVQNKQGRFASNLRFIDPASQKTAVLNGTGLMLAHPALNSVFPSTSFFTPHLVLRNTSPLPQTATVSLQYSDGQFQSQSLPTITLPPHDLSNVDFSAFLSGLSDTSVIDAGVTIESSGRPGSLVAEMTSTDQNGTTAVDVPLVALNPVAVGTGAHPFRLGGDLQAVLHLKNLDREKTTAIVQILHDDEEFTLELVKLGPEESIALDLRELRDSQTQDVHGHRLPADFVQGQVQWFQHGKQHLMGRVIQSSPSLGIASSFSCGGLCCPPSFYSLNINPGSLDGIPEDTFDLTMTETDFTCGQFYGPFNVTEYVTCTSDNPAVAEAYGTTIEMEDEGLTNINVEHMATTFERGFTECESGPCEPNCIQSDNLLTEALTALVRIPHHLRVISDETSTAGCGSQRRLITFQVVDRNNNAVKISRDKETFHNATTGASLSSVFNSCQNDNIAPSSCSVDANGRIIDQLWVGCPSTGGSCGTDQFISKWSWCPVKRAAVPLASNTYHIHHSFVFVNGGEQFAPGTQLFP